MVVWVALSILVAVADVIAIAWLIVQMQVMLDFLFLAVSQDHYQASGNTSSPNISSTQRLVLL